WHAVFQITGNALDAVSPLADHREAATPAILVLREAEACIEVREIINQLLDVVTFVFERGGNCQPVSLGEETDDPPAARRHAESIDESKAPPKHRDTSGGGQLFAYR